MQPKDVIRALTDPSPGFLCSNLSEEHGTARFRVPVAHGPLAAFALEQDAAAGKEALAELPDLESTRQLRALVSASHGLALWVPKRLLSTKGRKNEDDEQAAAGSVVVYPPAEWAMQRDEFDEWQADADDETFDDLPYTPDDMLFFAGVNYTPNRWFLVLRGPMAGNVCWWTHDGDSVLDEPWARDIRAWGDRIFATPPEELFGGTIRFSAKDSIDPAPAGAELYPLEYQPAMSTT